MLVFSCKNFHVFQVSNTQMLQIESLQKKWHNLGSSDALKG